MFGFGCSSVRHDQFATEGEERAGSDDDASNGPLSSGQREDVAMFRAQVHGRLVTGLVERLSACPDVWRRRADPR